MKTSDKAIFVYLSQEDSDYLISEKPEYGMKRVPKLGLMYLAAVLEKEGIKVRIDDQTLEPFTLNQLLERLKNDDCLFVGFYSATALKDKVIRYIKAIRQADASVPILVGGPGFYSAADYLNAGCDIVCRGEGERTIAQIVQYLQGRIDISDVKGISYKSNGRIMEASAQGLIENLDDIPMPRRGQGNGSTDYYDFHIFNMRTPYTTMLASRGCPYSCTYCSSCNIWGKRIRQRSPQNVVAEIDYCVKELGIRYIGFRDDVFGFGNDWVVSFCNLMTDRRYKVLWSCMVHPLSFVRDRGGIIGLLKKAGCDMLIFGLQSAHPEILKNIKRSAREPEELAQTVKAAKELGISTVVEFIFGLPGETEDTIRTSIDYVLRLKPHYAQFNALSVLEGSEIESVFGDNPVCGLSEERARKWCALASRRFYSSAGLLLQDVLHIINKNPAWFLKTARYVPYILGYLGFNKTRHNRKAGKDG